MPPRFNLNSPPADQLLDIIDKLQKVVDGLVQRTKELENTVNGLTADITILRHRYETDRTPG